MSGKKIVGVLFLLAICTAATLAQAQEPSYRVFTYPEQLDVNDTLQDSLTGERFPTQDDTLLIWVDMEPGLRYLHRSAYVLITARGVRIHDGIQGWPLVNQVSAFGEPPLFQETNDLVRFPRMVRAPEIVARREIVEDAKIYASPFPLRAGDELQLSLEGRSLWIEGETFLTWVDLHPRMRFVHDTLYLLVGPGGVQVHRGDWWPVVNGRTILYGERNDWGTASPFNLVFP